MKNSIFITPEFRARTYPGKTMGPDYIGSHVENVAGINYGDFVDIEERSFDDFETSANEMIKSGGLGFVGISYLSMQSDSAMEYAKRVDAFLRGNGLRNKNTPQIYVPIIAGGRGTTSAKEYAHLFPEIDLWVNGREFHQPFDSMERISKILQTNRLFLREVLKDIPGVVYLDEDSNMIEENRPNNKAFHAFEDYFANLQRKNHHDGYNFEVFNGKKTAQMFTQSGCLRACNFCFEGQRKCVVKKRDLAKFAQELDNLIGQGYEAFYFDDSTFTADKKYCMEMMKILKERHVKNGIVWGFNTRVDCLDEEVIKAAKEAGAGYMFAGIESMVPEVVEGFGKFNGKPSPDYKKVNNGAEYIKRAKEVYKLMGEVGLKKSAFIIFGGRKRNSDGTFSPETFDDAKRSIRDTIFDLQPDYLTFNGLRFVPDAPISYMNNWDVVRGSQKYNGGHYYSKYREAEKVQIDLPSHPIYRVFESAIFYPLSNVLTPEYCYRLAEEVVKTVNEYRQKTGKFVKIVTDEHFEKYNLDIDENGFYHLVPFDQIK